MRHVGWLAPHGGQDDVVRGVEGEFGVPPAGGEVGVDLDEVEGAHEAGGVAVLQQRHRLAQRQAAPN